MNLRFARAAFCAAAMLALAPAYSVELPREMKLLPKPQVAMLCALQMTNLAILAQREPTGPEDEAVMHSANLYTLALAWLPHAQPVAPEEQQRLSTLVIEQTDKEQMEQSRYCADAALALLKKLPPVDKASLTASGLNQAIRLHTEVRKGG